VGGGFKVGGGIVHEKPDLLKAFHEHRTHDFDGEPTGPPSPEKLNLGLAEMQFPAVLMGLSYLHSSVFS